MAPASSQGSIPFNEEEAFAEQYNLLQGGVKATLAFSRPCPRLGYTEREVNKVKHSVTDSGSLLVNQ